MSGATQENASIVVLDGFTLNPGDLLWERFRSLGELTVYDRTPPAETIERAARARIVLTNKTVLNSEVIGSLPDLRYIGVLATGYNNVDIRAAAKHSIPVTNVPAYSTNSVAQLVFAHILHIANHVAEHNKSVHAGKWSQCEDFSFWDFPQVELAGQTLGVVGFGRIGRSVAQIGQAFGMNVLVATRSTPPDLPDYVTLADLKTCFSESDIVSLHCPLTKDTRHLVNRDMLARMKPNAILVNTSRGPVVDEDALALALQNGTIAAAAVDVLSDEPPPRNNPLIGVENCCITPHLGWATRAARERLMAKAFENVKAFLDGEKQNVVNASLLHSP